MEQIFIYPILVFTSYLLYKVFNLKSRENKLRNEKSCLQDTLDTLIKAEEHLSEVEVSNDLSEDPVKPSDEAPDIDAYTRTFSTAFFHPMYFRFLSCRFMEGMN